MGILVISPILLLIVFEMFGEQEISDLPKLISNPDMAENILMQSIMILAYLSIASPKRIRSSTKIR